MIEFRVEWDAATYAQFWNFASYDNYLREMMSDLADAFGEEGVRFIRPLVKGNGKWQPSTGKTAAGIDYEVTKRGSDVTVNFVGRNKADNGGNIAHWIDVGNFDPGRVLWANQYGYKAFPISARAGSVTQYFAKIHGMGHASPEYPKNFSDKGVIHLASKTPNLADKALDDLLRKLVN